MPSCKTDEIQYTDMELNIYESEKNKMFKGTIAICIIYAIIAIIMLSSGYFTEIGKNYIFSTLLPFTIVFIIGTISVILYFTYKIYNYKPKRAVENNLKIDDLTCPDYWKLEEVPDTSKTAQNGENESAFTYKCVMDLSIFDKNKMIKAGYRVSNTPTPTVQGTYNDNNHIYKEIESNNKDINFKKYAMIMNNYKNSTRTPNTYTPVDINDNSRFKYKKNEGDSYLSENVDINTDNVPLTCDTLYPLFLAEKDNDIESKNGIKNKYRCAYAKKCGIPWTEANCS